MAFATLRAGVSVRPAATPRRAHPRRVATPVATKHHRRGGLAVRLPNVPRAARRSRRATRRRRVFLRVGRRASNGRRGGNVTSRPPTLAESDSRAVTPRLRSSRDALSPLDHRLTSPPLAPHPARRQTTRVAPPDGGFSAETTDDVVAPPSLAGRPGAPPTSPTPKRLSTVRSPLPRRKPPRARRPPRPRPPPPAPPRASARLAAPRSTCEISSRAR